MTRVKICGITSLDDALYAVEAGADAIGFVFADKSPRKISFQKASAIISKLPVFVQSVGLFVDEEPEKVNWAADFCGLDIIQLHGDETAEYCLEIKRRVIKALRVSSGFTPDSVAAYSSAAILLDAWSESANGGTGVKCDWSIAANIAKQRDIILAGGLNPQNIKEAIERVKPYAVDVSSGVESSPGVKNRDLVSEFIQNAKFGAVSTVAG